MASFTYTTYKAGALTGAVDLTGHIIKVMLVGSSYGGAIQNGAAETTHRLTGDVISYEIAGGGGYEKGGKVLTNRTVTADTVDKEGAFDADDVSWTSSTITASGAIVYVSGTRNSIGNMAADNSNEAVSKSWVLAFIDFGGLQSSSNGTFQIVWNSEGIINWS